MAIKESMENVLGVRISEADVERIKTYYKCFYDAPSDFENDQLVDVILDDLGLERPVTLLGKVNMIDLADMKHSDPYHTMVWGNYRGELAYAMQVSGEDADELVSLVSCSVGVKYDKDIPTILVEQSRKDPRDVIAIVTMDGRAFFDDTHGESVEIPGYRVVDIMPMVVEGQLTSALTYAVAFVKSGSGNIPVLWNIHDGSAYSSNGYATGELPDVASGIVKDDLKEMLHSLEQKYPRVDLDTASDEDRYVKVRIGNRMFVYNRNHVLNKSNVDSAVVMLPAIYDAINVPDLNTNLYACLSKMADWDDVYFRVFLESGQDVGENAKIDAGDEVVNTGTSGNVHIGSSMIDAVKTSAGTAN